MLPLLILLVSCSDPVPEASPPPAADASVVAAAATLPAAEAPPSPDPRRGRQLFRAHCAACHGMMADGDGPAQAALSPAPTNLTDPARAASAERLEAIIRHGIQGTPMMAFQGTLSDEEIRDVVAWVATLPGGSALADPGAARGAEGAADR